jgi:hypothetical protein
MARTPQYEAIEDDLAAGRTLPRLKVKVFGLLKKHPEGLGRLDLIEHIFGSDARQAASVQLAKDPKDRKIRKAIEALRDDGILVEASFGRPGYRLSDKPDPRIVEEMIAEWGSMIKKLQKRIKMARRHLPKSASKGQLATTTTKQTRMF